MAKRVAALVIAIVAMFGLTAGPAAAEEIFDCEGNIRLACPGPVPW
ncbi:MAG: hypothetical protein ACRDKT_00970 [Actinomycetota bacterium]